MNSSKGICFLFCITFVASASGLGESPPGQLKCTRDTGSYCACTMSDKSGRYDLSSLVSERADKPFFHFSGRNASETFFFDPCVRFSVPVSGRKTACENVAGCQVDVYDAGAEQKTNYISIAKQSTVEFHYDTISDKMTFKYTNDDIFHPVTTEVHLNCVPESQPTMIQFFKATSIAVAFSINSPKSCLIPTQDGLSAGSILCIIFSLAFIVYFVGGTLLLVFIQNKSLTEAIPPNKDFWLDLPDLIKDGAKFAMSGFNVVPPTHQRLGREEDDTVYHDEVNDDDDEDELKVQPGGGSAQPLDGFTAVPV